MSSCCADPADWVQLGPVSSVCGVFSLQQYAYTWGMSIPFVDPWERSSISLLGTALMRPGILPFIPHSLQLGTAHSFSLWPQRSVCIQRHNAAGQGCPLPSEASLHKPPLIYLENCSFQDLEFCPPAAVTTCCVFVFLPLLKRILSQRIQRKVIWSWFADLANMECITFLEFREENQLCNANQIYFLVDFYTNKLSWRRGTSLSSKPQGRVLFSILFCPIRVCFYLILSSFFILLLSVEQRSI